jgi:hypothetical protein
MVKAVGIGTIGSKFSDEWNNGGDDVGGKTKDSDED